MYCKLIFLWNGHQSALQNVEAVSALHCRNVQGCLHGRKARGSERFVAEGSGRARGVCWTSPPLLLCSFQWGLVTTSPEGKCETSFGSRVKCPP